MSPDEFSTINPNWLLLDTCSTDNVINNENLVKNIRPCKRGEEMRMVTNGGHMDFNKEADLLMLPIKVHFNKDSIANVLSFKKLSEVPGVHITTNTRKERAFFVHIGDKTMKFSSCRDGLYYYDMSEVIEVDDNKIKQSVSNYMSSDTNRNNSHVYCKHIFLLLSTVEENKKNILKNKLIKQY